MKITEYSQYEDSYSATEYDNFDGMFKDLQAVSGPDSPYCQWNVPVWVNYDEEDEMERGYSQVEVGIMLTRHGRTLQLITPATPEQVHELRLFMVSVWAHRADTGFQRYRVLGFVDAPGI